MILKVFFCVLTLYVNYVSTFAIESFVIIVNPKAQTCFSKRFTETIRVIFEYTVVEGGNMDINAKIVSPNSRRIYNELKKNKDEVSFMTSIGDFKFCFGNEFSSFSKKRIAFNLRPFEVVSLSEETGDQEPRVKEQIEVFCDDIHMWMTSIMDFQMKYRVRESIGRFVAENLNTRVMWWSIVQAAIVVAAGLSQVFILKMFFTEKRKSTKPMEGEMVSAALG